MIPLCLAQRGEAVIIKKIGGSPQVRQHLENLGFNVGGEVVIVNTLGENLLVRVKQARVALSDGLARKIFV
ncbi:MAG: ferrous iron transport protein A [Clostridia bacterium]|nr:ferrous iron transport protein A [Clostridia bacterium]